jgi:hypothetical protein
VTFLPAMEAARGDGEKAGVGVETGEAVGIRRAASRSALDWLAWGLLDDFIACNSFIEGVRIW